MTDQVVQAKPRRWWLLPIVFLSAVLLVIAAAGLIGYQVCNLYRPYWETVWAQKRLDLEKFAAVVSSGKLRNRKMDNLPSQPLCHELNL